MAYSVIKENDLFLITDLSGDISTDSKEGFGLYTKDTRFLSRLALTVNGSKPIVLASEVDRNYVSNIVLTNPDIKNGEKLWRESVEIVRTRFIYKGILYETIGATNFNPQSQRVSIDLEIDADFQDMFVIRGFQDGQVGQKTRARQLASGFSIDYGGVDDVKRSLLVEWIEAPAHVVVSNDGAGITYQLDLEAGQSTSINLFFVPVIDDVYPERHTHAAAIQELQRSYANWEQTSTWVSSNHPFFDRLYRRGLSDIRALLTDLGFGLFPVAGLPWYAVPFGRDSLITALQLLPVHPEIAKGTIMTMARYQGEKSDSWRDEQPGKIMHELRDGELANTNQVPFKPYYGTVDATPLFLILIGEYVKWTDDMVLFEEMIPNIKRALEWIDACGDLDESGFVTYNTKSAKGITNQGWKDSSNSVIHRNGEYAKAPIALAEVQGYVYQAKTTIAELLRTMKPYSNDYKMIAWSSNLIAEAEELAKLFEKGFWVESDQFYALALDGDRKQVETVTSNPGHLLMSGILKPHRAEAVADKLVSKELFSGYGIRTMAEGEKGYNPISYHNGSVWPHDNSLCLMGLNHEGFHKEALTVMEGLLAAGDSFENHRLPELFCGYTADKGAPLRYPVACSPQAWAAATPFVFIEVMLGMRLDYTIRQISLHPVLPVGMDLLSVRSLRLGSGMLDVDVKRRNETCAYHILANTTGWTIGSH
ncbi:amylo-alpha-1,6-glucosidase [Paenibacillus sp. FSL K6-0276]|uniref:amylo-alpha-1,6-glucosidase n=1 Tax=Paenibacillus sp. FSL K6-0276 TaxID=2921450 RepID=UPI0030EC458F